MTTKITDILPAHAINIADNAEYSAWRSVDGSEVFIDMKDPEVFVTDAILTTVLYDAISNGFEDRILPGKVYLPNTYGLGPVKLPKKNTFPIDVYVSDFGAVDVIDLKREEEEFEAAKRGRAAVDFYLKVKEANGEKVTGFTMEALLSTLKEHGYVSEDAQIVERHHNSNTETTQ